MHDLPIHTAFFLTPEKGKVVLELSLLLEDVPGALALIAAKVRDHGGDVKWGMTHKSDEPGKAWWCTFLVIEEDRVEDLLDALREESIIDRLEYSVHRGGLVCGRHHSRLMTLGGRAIILRMSWLPVAFRLLKKHFGEEALRALMYLVGLDVGRAAHRDHRRYLEAPSKEEYLNACLNIMRALGWISGGSWRRSQGKLILELENPFEHVLGGINFLRGIVAGCLSELEGRKYKCSQAESRGEVYELIVEPEDNSSEISPESSPEESV